MSELEMDQSYEQMFLDIAESLAREGKTDRANDTLDQLMVYIDSGDSALDPDKLRHMAARVIEAKNNLKK
jgi:hypothetical protein